jgi:DNA-binding NarL/FixJ family response regulator
LLLINPTCLLGSDHKISPKPTPLRDIDGKPDMSRDNHAVHGRLDLQEKTQALDSNRNALVHIVGPLKLQNELMSRFLERETGLTCVCCEVPGLIGLDMKTEQRTVILWDFMDTHPDDLWSKLAVGSNSHCLVALFNVPLDQRICKEAINRGVRGIFFESEPPSTFARGVQAILDKELWFPRDTLANCLFDKRDASGPSIRSQDTLLTLREKEILMMIASGLTNSKIADDLCISPNTVKTHIYNIYHKINVPNRLQAALWASRNL